MWNIYFLKSIQNACAQRRSLIPLGELSAFDNGFYVYTCKYCEPICDWCLRGEAEITVFKPNKYYAEYTIIKQLSNIDDIKVINYRSKNYGVCIKQDFNGDSIFINLFMPNNISFIIKPNTIIRLNFTNNNPIIIQVNKNVEQYIKSLI